MTPNIKTSSVNIRYRTSHGIAPEDTSIIANEPLLASHLPELTATNYKFLGWVHVNSDGYESTLSERMILSTDWLIPLDVKNNQYYVVFTAKWRRESSSGQGQGKDGEDGFSPIATVTPTNNGAIISITDVNGTTRATVLNGQDGKDGKNGTNGKDGVNGENGADGYTPVRGTDYWTPNDIAEIKTYVDDAILGGAW